MCILLPCLDSASCHVGILRNSAAIQPVIHDLCVKLCWVTCECVCEHNYFAHGLNTILTPFLPIIKIHLLISFLLNNFNPVITYINPFPSVYSIPQCRT